MCLARCGLRCNPGTGMTARVGKDREKGRGDPTDALTQERALTNAYA